MDQITITLPLTERGLWVILSAIGLAAATGLVWLTLSEQDRKTPRNPLSWLIAFGWVLLPLWLAIFCASLWQVWAMLTGAGSILTGPGSLGAGALIAALLGAPFVIWGTVLKQRTVDFQKEGHITDRINKAVEQLGAEKTVDRIGRPVLLQQGHSDHVDDPNDISFRTIIQWRGEVLSKRETEFVTNKGEGEWQAFSETLPNIEVRIGAILSLERIAQDSTRYDKGRDHVRVMEILCAYVRGNSNVTLPQDYPEPDWEPLKDDATEEERRAHLEKRQERFGDFFLDSKAWKWARNLPAPRADIAQALQVLGRRTADQRRAETAWPDPPSKDTVWPFDTACPELREGTDENPLTSDEIAAFKNALKDWRTSLRDYSGYRLDLRGANLQGADLSAKRPDDSDAVFSGALLQGARMEGANIFMTKMEGVNLARTRMEGAYLERVRMEGAHLRSARMEGANLASARMEGTLLAFARMEGADLEGARMEGADLERARMEGAHLARARMEGVENLSAALLRGAALRFFDGAKVSFTQEQINVMFGDASVTLPKGIARPAHWPDWELPEIGPHGFHREYLKWLATPFPSLPHDGGGR